MRVAMTLTGVRQRFLSVLLLMVSQAGMPVPCVRAQQVVDRIVARVEEDIILLSDLRELGAYQQLVDGRTASDDRLLTQLVEQWIVHAEATAARFPRPSEAEVNRELNRLEHQFPGPEAFRSRLRELGLAEGVVRRLVERQLYLARYLDYKFRPAADVDGAAVEKYYREHLLPSLTGRGLAVPGLEAVQEQIRELLTQREISERATRWLEETRSRLKIEWEAREKASAKPR